MSKKIFHRVDEFYNDIKDLRDNGVSKGVGIGFHCLEDLYSVKSGGTTYIYSAPFSGKTMFVLEMCLNLAVQYDWVTGIYSPESGNKEEIVAELVFKMTGKELYSKHNNAIDDELLKQALTFIQEHFIFIDPETKGEDGKIEDALISVTDFYNSVNQAEQYYDTKIHLTVGDPFNEFSHNFKDDEGRQDLYIERILGIVRRDAKRNDRHNIIVTHVGQQQLQVRDGKRYYEAATARDIAGGQAWYRKGMMMLSLWRPPAGLKDGDRVFLEQELDVIVQKAKPRYCGKKGVGVLFYDYEKGRYYEVVDGQKYYAFQYEKFLNQNRQEGKIMIN